MDGNQFMVLHTSACVMGGDGAAAAAVDLRASLKAALLGGPSVLTGDSSLIAASCLNGGEKGNCSSGGSSVRLLTGQQIR